MSVKVFCCETCDVLVEYIAFDELATHEGHTGTAVVGEDRDELFAVGAKHLVLARRIRSGGPYGLADL